MAWHMAENRPMTVIPIQDELPDLIRLLREPAGEDPRFASPDLIQENQAAFIEKVHATWKALHNRSLDEILRIERMLTSEQRERLPKGFVWYLDRTVVLWRRINDAIVWMLVSEQDHVIRTICHRKARPRLSKANPEPMLKFLENVNADPMTIAVWSDATTCVDLGDVVCRSFSGKLNGFLEVKEGVVNDRILELMAVKGTQEEIVDRIIAFAEEHGGRALKQLERVARQRQRYNQFMDILDEDHGFDPRRQAEVTLQESTIPIKHYDLELQEIIESSQAEVVLRCIDRCLWVYVDRDRLKSIENKIENFERSLTEARPASMRWFREFFGGKEPFAPVVVEANLSCPEAVPLFLRQLEPETIRDLLMGKLMFSVYLFLDWYELGRMIAEMGGELVWSTVKEGRRARAKPMAQRVLTFGERIPRIQLPDGNFVEGFAKIYRILFEGITPSTIVAQYVELLRFPRTARENDLHEGSEDSEK
jgi:hypothetical protein